MRIWAKIRTDQQTVAQAEENLRVIAFTDKTLAEAIEGVCQMLDLAIPVILKKHVNQMTNFSKTNFTKHDFAEPINFDSLEIEYLE